MEKISIKEFKDQSNIEIIKELMKVNNGYITSKLVSELGIHRMYLNIMVKRNIIKKIISGVYVDIDIESDYYYALNLNLPGIVYSHMTALYFHGLSNIEPKEYVILNNEIYKEWAGITAKEYKSYKGLRKESLRDNMSDIEVELADLGEIAIREIAKKKNSKGLNENIEIAKRGRKIAGKARKDLENEIGESVVTSDSMLNCKYIYIKEIKMYGNRLKIFKD